MQRMAIMACGYVRIIISVNIILEIAKFRFYTCMVENEDGQKLEQRIISHRRLNGCIGDILFLKSLNNEYKLDIQQ